MNILCGNDRITFHGCRKGQTIKHLTAIHDCPMICNDNLFTEGSLFCLNIILEVESSATTIMECSIKQRMHVQTFFGIIKLTILIKQRVVRK